MSSKGFTKYVIFLCMAVLTAAVILPVSAFAAAPHKVTGVKVSTGVTTAKISWSAASHATYYYVYRGSTLVKKLSAKSARSYTATGLAPGKSYTFRVRAKNTRYGSYSSSAVAKTQPVGLAGLFGSYADRMIVWDESAGAVRYIVYVDVLGYPVGTYTITDTFFDASYLAPFGGIGSPKFTITPVSAYGVTGTSAEWVAVDSTETFGEGLMTDSIAVPAGYVVLLEDTETGFPYSVFVDDDSLFSSSDPDVTIETAADFVDYLTANPTTSVGWIIVENDAKTSGTNADFYLTYGDVLNAPQE